MEGGYFLSTAVTCVILFLAAPPGCQGQNQSPPTFTAQPTETVYYLHDTKPEVVLPCAANGTNPLQYRWTNNAVAVEMGGEGARGNLIANETGNYTCLASNAFGTAVSRTVQVKFAYLDPFDDSDSPTTFSVEERDSLVLPCNAPPGDPTPLVLWTKDDVINVFSNNTLAASWDPERDLALDQAGNLVFLHASTADAGRYECKVKSPVIGTHLWLSVKKVVTVTQAAGAGDTPPRILDGLGQTDAIRGQDVKMYCLATGHPAPIVTWTKYEDPYFSYEGPVLTMRGVQLTDAGVYTCEARSTGHPAVNRTRVLHVEVAPYWTTRPRDVTVHRGDNGVLSCEASGEPVPRLTWMENGDPKPEYDNHTSVTVENVDRGDVNVYQCIAFNSHGQIIANAILNIYQAGPAPTGLKYETLNGNTVLISWKAIHNPSLQTFMVKYRRKDGQHAERHMDCGTKTSCRLVQLRRNAWFTYRVVAVYDTGAVSSKTKEFTTRRSLPGGSGVSFTRPALWNLVIIASSCVLVLGVSVPLIMCIILCIRDQVNGPQAEDELPTDSDAWGPGRPKPKDGKPTQLVFRTETHTVTDVGAGAVVNV